MNELLSTAAALALLAPIAAHACETFAQMQARINAGSPIGGDVCPNSIPTPAPAPRVNTAPRFNGSAPSYNGVAGAAGALGAALGALNQQQSAPYQGLSPQDEAEIERWGDEWLQQQKQARQAEGARIENASRAEIARLRSVYPNLKPADIPIFISPPPEQIVLWPDSFEYKGKDGPPTGEALQRLCRIGYSDACSSGMQQSSLPASAPASGRPTYEGAGVNDDEPYYVDQVTHTYYWLDGMEYHDGSTAPNAAEAKRRLCHAGYNNACAGGVVTFKRGAR
jgi:hypothetical protein